MGKATFYCGGCGVAFRNEESEPASRCLRCRPAAERPTRPPARRIPGTARRTTEVSARGGPALYLLAGAALLALVLAAGFALSRKAATAHADTVAPAARRE